MCIQYWPPAQDKTEVYGDIHIGIYKEEQLANFQIRTFRIWKENAEVRGSFPPLLLAYQTKKHPTFHTFHFPLNLLFYRMSSLNCVK